MADTQSYIQGLQNAQNLLNQIQTKLGELKAQQSTPAPPTPPSLSSSTSAASYSTPSGAATYSTPSTTVPSSAIQSSYTGSSIVDYLNLAGQPSDFSSRAKLAQQYGIPNYTGTAAQNTQLLNLLRSGSTPSGTSAGTASGYSQPVSQPTSSMSTASQLAALQSQLADVQAQKDALTRYGLTDTSQLVKSSSGEYIPAKYDTLETNLTERAKSYLDQYLQPIDYDSLATQAKKMVEQNYASIQDSLNQVVNNIKAQYDAAKQDLLDAQVQELEDLKGEYSVRGLLDSGAYTEAKRKLQESQKKELADLEQKESQDIANLHYSIMSKMPDQIIDITNSLAQELQRRRNEALSLLGTLLSYQQQQEEGKTRQEEVASTVEVVNEKGERYIVLLNSRGQEIGRIYAGKSTTTPEIIGGQQTGYYQYDPATQTWKQIIGSTSSTSTTPTTTLTANQKNTIDALNKATIIADQIEAAVNKLNLADSWLEVPIRYGFLSAGAATKTDVNAVAYKALVNGLLSQLARATGEVGVLTDQDIQRVKSLLPDFNDTKATAQAKIDQLRNFFTALKNSIAGTSQTSSSMTTSTTTPTTSGEKPDISFLDFGI